MRDWMRNNSTGVTFLAVGICLVAGVSFLSFGCTASDLIQVRVPLGVQRSINAPKIVTLTDAPHEWDRWQLFVETETEKFADQIATSKQLLGFVESFANTGLGVAEQALGGIPFGGAAVGGLGLLAGIFFDKPGAKNKEAKEKEASYNAGIQQGKTIAEEIARNIRV